MEQQSQTAKMEMAPRDLYEIYTRIRFDESFAPAPVDKSANLSWLKGLSAKGIAGLRRQTVEGGDIFEYRRWMDWQGRRC